MRIDKLLASLQAAGLATAQSPIYRRSFNDSGNATDAQNIASGGFANSAASLTSSSTAATTPMPGLNNETTTAFETVGVTDTAFEDVTITAVSVTNGTATTFETVQLTSTVVPIPSSGSTRESVVNGTATTSETVQLTSTVVPSSNSSSTAVFYFSNQTAVASSFAVNPVDANATSSLNTSSVSLTLTAAETSPTSISALGTTVITSGSTASAVQVLSPMTQTITRVATTTDYITVDITETAYVQTTEYLVTITDYITKYVTVTLSALTPIVQLSTSVNTACATGRTVVITLPASASPTIVATPGESLSGTTYTVVGSTSTSTQPSVVISSASVTSSMAQQTTAGSQAPYIQTSGNSSSIAPKQTFGNSSSIASIHTVGNSSSVVPVQTFTNSNGSFTGVETRTTSVVYSSTVQASSNSSTSQGGSLSTSADAIGLNSTTGMLSSTSTSTHFTTVTTTYTTNGGPTTLTTISPVIRVVAAASSSSVICNATATSIIRANRPHPTLFCNNWDAAKPHTTSPFGKLTVKQVSNACGCILAQPKSSSSVSSSTVKTSSSTWTTSTRSSSSSVCSTATAPAPTQTGIASGCTEYYVAVSGDYCYLIADKYNLDVDTFMAWNPAVNAPSCSNVQIGDAYCVARGCASSGSSSTLISSTGTTTTASTKTSTATSSSATSTGSAVPYKMYTGNGTVAAGWPSLADWVDFDTMFTLNEPIMLESCENNWDVANDSTDEIADMRAAITSIATAHSVDPRFILAIIMQESNGCVRVVTTSWSVANPGLMQSHDGNGTCNDAGMVQDPCPEAEIYQMIEDGTAGTSSGDGLVQCLAEADVSDVSRYYRAARIYNGGVGGYNADNLGSGCCTLCYASDVANRLTGWSTGTSGCTL